MKKMAQHEKYTLVVSQKQATPHSLLYVILGWGVPKNPNVLCFDQATPKIFSFVKKINAHFCVIKENFKP